MNIKLENGAEVSIIPLTFLYMITEQLDIWPNSVMLQSFQGDKVKPVGIVHLHCKFKATEAYINFMVVECYGSDTPILLGMSLCTALNMIKRVNTVSKSVNTPKFEFIRGNEHVSNGKFPKPGLVPTVEGAKPASWLPTKVSNALKEPLKEELDMLVHRNAIIQVEHLTLGDLINKIV